MKIEIPYTPRQWAGPFHESLKRWIVLVLHRRAGKSTAVINHHQMFAMSDDHERDRLRYLSPDISDEHLDDLCRSRKYGHVCPTYKQAKLTMWEMCKYFADPIPGVDFNEAELTVKYPNGSRLMLFGADNPDSMRGTAFSGLSFDEFGMQPPNIFSEVLSKSLGDHLGYGIFAGTIKGKNQLWQAYNAAVNGKHQEDYYALWQDIDQSLATETDASTLMLKQALEDDLRLISDGLMSQEEFDQEWYLSVDAAIFGGYFTSQLSKARKEGRITRIPYDPALPVDTDWDIGVDDETAIWFSQSLKTGEVRLIDYEANSGVGLDYYVKLLREKDYVYGQHWGPHDIAVREWGSAGKSRIEIAAALGLKFEVTPRLEVADSINATRLFLNRCWFDEQKCSAGLEGLTHYRKAYNERTQQFTGKPVHDWATHPSDAFRGLATRHRPPEKKRERRSPFQGRRGSQGGPAALSWMS